MSSQLEHVIYNIEMSLTVSHVNVSRWEPLISASVWLTAVCFWFTNVSTSLPPDSSSSDSSHLEKIQMIIEENISLQSNQFTFNSKRLWKLTIQWSPLENYHRVPNFRKCIAASLKDFQIPSPTFARLFFSALLSYPNAHLLEKLIETPAISRSFLTYILFFINKFTYLGVSLTSSWSMFLSKISSTKKVKKVLLTAK